MRGQECQEQISNDVTAVIPALNAARTLAATLASLAGVEALVVDGGSVDETVAIARAGGAGVLHAVRGRGVQLAAGVAAVSTGWVLLLHADTRLAAGWRAHAAAFMRQPGDRAGYFRFTLDRADPRARRLERAVAWRCRVLRLPYGDQGLLVSRRRLAAVGGVRPLPLMEDVDLARRLRHCLAPIDAAALTSAAKWERDGWMLRSARNLACLALWYGGLSPARIARLYR